MKRVLCILSLCAVALTGWSQSIDSSRLPPAGYWNPGVVGANGMSYRQNGFFVPPCTFTATNSVAAYGATGNGTTDDTAAIQSCINASAGKVVYFPPGTYKTTATLTLGDTGYPFKPVQIELLGASPTNTFIKGYGDSGPIINASGGGLLVGGQQTVLSQAAHRGDTLLHVAVWNTLFQNEPVGMIWKENSISGNDCLDGAATFGTTNIQAYEGQARCQMFNITGADASHNLIGISPPLYMDWPTNTPVYFTPTADGSTVVGIENLSVENDNGGGGAAIDNIKFSDLNNSWIRNCESVNATGYHIRLEECYHCTVEGCYVHHYQPTGGWAGGNSDYGVDCIKHSTDNLIINNHFDRCRHACPAEYGACGNVWAYNYESNPVQQNLENTTGISPSDLQHGCTQWNLWEGNITPCFVQDDVLGGSVNNVAFREQFTRVAALNTLQTGWGFDIQANNLAESVLGCVNCNLVHYVPTFRIGAPDPNGNQPTTWASWFSCESCDFFPYAAGEAGDVMPSLFVNGVVLLGTDSVDTSFINWNPTNNWNDTANFSYIKSLTATNTIIWTTGYSNSLPSSLWLSVKPAFLNVNAYNSVNYPWPGQGPDVTGYTNQIPALVNFFGNNGSAIILTNISTANFSLNVNNGIGSSSYSPGITVSITAAAPPSGYQFSNWSGDIGTVANINSASTVLTMPTANITVTANFAPLGSGSSPVTTTNPPVTSGSVPATTNGPVAWYAFDDGSGSAAADSSGHGNTGTLMNSPAWVSGIIGSSALGFNGNNQYVSLPNNSSMTLAGMSAATVSAWVKTTAGGTVVSSGGACINYGNYALIVDGTGAMVQFVNANSASGQFNLWSASRVNDGKWHLISGVLNGASITIYVDGTFSAVRNDFPGVIFNDGGNSPVNIGATAAINGCGSPAINYFKGMIDDVRIYNRALSAVEIQNLYLGAGATLPSPPGKLFILPP